MKMIGQEVFLMMERDMFRQLEMTWRLANPEIGESWTVLLICSSFGETLIGF